VLCLFAERASERCRTEILPHLGPFPVCACRFCCPPGSARRAYTQVKQLSRMLLCRVRMPAAGVAVEEPSHYSICCSHSTSSDLTHSFIHALALLVLVLWERIDECCAPNAARVTSSAAPESLTFCCRARENRAQRLSFHPQNQQKIFQELEERDAMRFSQDKHESTKLFVGMAIFLLFLAPLSKYFVHFSCN
jgi:hypothetical protein